ncbi:serine/threonine-protein kinase pakF-like [Montipora foliosa]|uniref:serine/threonine-protein kinase pakF-like n=1 Tax=Montipora foliosa TaxID=591990 RepID=UPI0035F138FF
MAKNMNNERKPDWDELRKIVAEKSAKAETVNRKAEASAPHQINETFAIQGGQFQEDVHYLIEETVGHGSFGVCYKATAKCRPLTFCMKIGGLKEKEILALTLAKKDNVQQIVDYFGAKRDGGMARICMEYMIEGTLKEHIQRQRMELSVGAWPIIDEKTCFVFLGDILKGLAFLNGKGLVHGDIKGDNVLLVESRTHVKLADFGLAQKIQEHVGCPDIWKTGCLHIEMLNGKRSSLLDGDDHPEEHIPSQATDETKEFLKLVLDREPLLSAAEILAELDSHPYLRKYSNPSYSQ